MNNVISVLHPLSLFLFFSLGLLENSAPIDLYSCVPTGSLVIRNREERGKRKRKRKKKAVCIGGPRGQAGKGRRLRSQHSDGLIARWRSRSVHNVQKQSFLRRDFSFQYNILYYNKGHVSPLFLNNVGDRVQPLFLALKSCNILLS